MNTSMALLRAHKLPEGNSVLIKIPTGEDSQSSVFSEINNEFSMRSCFDSNVVLTFYEKLNIASTVFLELQDNDGVSLDTFLQKNTLSLSDGLSISIQLTCILEMLHANGILHGDIRPSNFLVHPETLSVVLFDLRFSRKLDQQKQKNLLERKLSIAPGFLSPEQSGRMDIEEDFRSDLYSLGVTLYKIFAGQLPFEQVDINELVHALLAKQPVSPNTINSGVPVALSEIIIKLIQKKPDDRYQSARALKFDLRESLQQLNNGEGIDNFESCRYETTEVFKVPSCIYGREEEIKKVLDAFDSISSQTEFVWLYGCSGIGKSALVQEVYRRLKKRKVVFLHGKCDQHNQNIPYGVIAQALNGLAEHGRTDNKTLGARLQNTLMKAMESPIGIAADVMPYLRDVLDDQSTSNLPPVEAQKRRALALSNFLEAIATPEQPLLLFFDDLQWADSASLNFINLMMESPSQNMLIVGAYRESRKRHNEESSQPIRQLRDHHTHIRHIHLPSLTLESVSELLADTLGSHATLTQSLADHLMMRTLGNPLFLHEKIHKLYKDGVFIFNAAFRRWDWCPERLQQHGGAGSSLELIIRKIQQLPKTAQQTLIYGACIGPLFDLSTLSALLDKPDHDVIEDLKEAVHENLVRLEKNSTAMSKGGIPKISYRFLHDQVQQAACSLITLHEKQEIQLGIGYFLLERISSEELENRIFEITHYFNTAKDLIDIPAEKLKVSKLNLQAGEKSKRATAYGVAYGYFDLGLNLLDNSSWDTDYDFCLALYHHAAETAYLNHQFERADHLIDLLLKRVTSNEERVSVQQIRIQALVYQKKNKAAVLLGLSVLKTLGIRLPASHSVANILLAYGHSKWMLRGKKTEDLETLPKMQASDMLSAMRILQSITASAYHAMPETYPLLILKMFSLSIKYGNSAESPLAYATYGAIVNGIEMNNSSCYRFGRLALKLLAHFDDVAIRQRTLLIYNLINRPSGEELHGSIEELRQCYKSGVDLGDLEYAVYTSNAYCMMLCLSGKNLSWVKDEMIRFNSVPPALNPGNTTNGNEALIQYVVNLLGENGDATDLNGQYFNEFTGFPEILETNQSSKVFTCYVFKMNLCLLLEDYAKGLDDLDVARQYENSSRGVVIIPMFYFYASLLHFAQYGVVRDKRHIQKGVHYKNKLRKWADQVPVNFLHRFLLTEAEYCRIQGKQDKALGLYDRAIRHSQENKYVQDEALAHELVARYWNQRGQRHAAHIYLVSALDAYKKWGCEVKVRHIQQQLTNTQSSGPFDINPATFLKQYGNQTLTSSLDMATILKASTALSSEVVFDRLLEKLMKFVIENAGAQAGYFIIDWGGKLFIEARQSVTDMKSIRLKIPVSETELVPKSVIEHVFQYRTDVVLHDARVNNPFSNDPSIVKAHVRSALCIPALNQGKLVGALYLENNLVSGAFTKDRVELLKLLSGQIAVSIENSILYENLEQKVQERTAEIQVQKEEIQKQKQLVEEKSQFKEQFFASMSHEIRTPMTAIIGMSELIFDTPLNDKQTEYAKGIKYSSENLLAIINDILDYAKIEAGKFSFVNKPFQIRERMTRLSYIVKQLAEEKGIALTTTIDPALPEQLIGDPLRLHQILLNLVSNAIKFTEKGAVSVTVLQASANENSVTISFTVRDTGVGIAEEKLNFIFETFSRIEDELNVPGTGLGLFIARKLVEEQGGKMTVSSKLKEGTAFQFTLSFQRARAAAIEEDEHDDVILSGTKILLVEDTLFNQVVAEEILKKIIDNPKVIVAENGKIALDKLAEQGVDIILMDIKMPVMDGYAASREIRLRPGLASVPILAFTSNASPGESEKCKAAGMNDFITKPIEAKKLKQKISKLLVPKNQEINF